MSPKISIITVCYNEPNLEQTCKSIITQTFQDFEWIVIDGGSNQKTLDIFEKYRDRINTFISEKDSGIYNAMNKGIKLANGDYLSFMNAGDSYSDEKSLQTFIDNGLDKDIIYSNCILKGKERVYPDVLNDEFWIKSCICHQTALIKKKLFDEYGLYNENYKIVSDYEKWIEFIYKNGCSYKHLNFISCCFDRTGISSTNRNLIKTERYDVIQKYFSRERIHEVLENRKYSLAEQLFSIKNHYDNKHKIITICFIHIKFKKKRNVKDEKSINHRDNWARRELLSGTSSK